MTNDTLEAEFIEYLKRGYAQAGIDFETVRRLRLARIESLEQLLREAEHEKYSEALIQHALGEKLAAQSSLAMMDGQLEAAVEYGEQSNAALRRAVEARKRR